MANSNGIISRPVSIADVAAVLGLSSGDLGTLIARAKSGGQQVTIGGVAFTAAYDIQELGGSASGALLPGALPYHNLYSRGPAHWELTTKTPTVGDELMVMELFNRINSAPFAASQRYGFNLADFDGYNHNALPPGLTLENPISLGYVGALPASAGLRMLLNPGAVDWVKLMQDSGIAGTTRPYAGVYKVTRSGYGNIALQNESESATVDLSGNAEAPITAFIATSSFTAAGTYTLVVEFKIGHTEALANPFRMDRWFTLNIPVTVKSRPQAGQSIAKYIDGQASEDATDLMFQNAVVLLYNAAGGGWTGSDSYTNVRLSVSGNVMTFRNSITVSWYVTRGYQGDQAGIMANGKLLRTATYSYSGPNGWVPIGINDFALTGWTINDADVLYVYVIITNYSG